MPDLNFDIGGVEPQHFAAVPTLLFSLRVTEVGANNSAPTLIHSVVLRCQIRIEPARRRYVPAEKERLGDLFGTPERWGQTLRPMFWTYVNTTVPAFAGNCVAELSVPCTFDFNVAATKYFAALAGGEIPLCFLFSGTVFYDASDVLQVAQIPWEKEAYFRLPAATWRAMMDHYYPNSAWVHLRRDVFEQVEAFRSRAGLPGWDQALARLVAAAEEGVTP